MSILKDFIKWYGVRLASQEPQPVPEPVPHPACAIVTQSFAIDLQQITLLDELILRMKWHRTKDGAWWGYAAGDNNTKVPPFCGPHVKHIGVYKGEEKVFVTIVGLEGKEPVTLEDEIGLYPSDALITSIRLVTGK